MADLRLTRPQSSVSLLLIFKRVKCVRDIVIVSRDRAFPDRLHMIRDD